MEYVMVMRYCKENVLPFTALVAMECTNVGLNTLFKAASLEGLSYYVFILYYNAIGTLFLLPLTFIFHRTTELPPLKFSLLCKIFSLGIIGVAGQLVGYAGISDSSPTLASAISSLTPAFTFILAVIFRMEKLGLKSSSSVAKILGTIVSISGAFVVVLYKGPMVISTSSSSSSSHYYWLPSSSSQLDWVIGGLLLVVGYLLVPIWYIIQTHIMKIYPAELRVVFLYELCVTFLSALVCLIVEVHNSSAWRLTTDIALVAIVYAGLFGSCLSPVVHSWGLRTKGPVYVSLFKPMSIVVAAAMSVIFLDDALYLGSVIGAIIISIGFYVVMWGKSKEEKEQDCDVDGLDNSHNQTAPLLRSYAVEET